MSDPYLIHDYLVAKYANPEVTKAFEEMDNEREEQEQMIVNELKERKIK
jgi:hypothetical protein